MLASVLFNLNSLVYPEGVDEKKKLFPFLQDSTTTTFVLEYFLDFLLLPYEYVEYFIFNRYFDNQDIFFSFCYSLKHFKNIPYRHSKCCIIFF